VLQKFRGELLLLDSRTAGDAGGSSASNRQADSRSYAGTADLDDDVPF
jgi:hypothetical protein